MDATVLLIDTCDAVMLGLNLVLFQYLPLCFTYNGNNFVYQPDSEIFFDQNSRSEHFANFKKNYQHWSSSGIHLNFSEKFSER